MMPIYDIPRGKGCAAMLLISFALALLAGFDDSVGYYLSLSRFFVFQPWFIIGYYCHKYSILNRVNLTGKKYFLILLASIIMVGVSIWIIVNENVSLQLLYGSYPYRKANGTIWTRTKTFFMALSWIVFLFAGMRPILNRRIICATRIGQNTLPVFLLHGFIVKMIDMYCPNLMDSIFDVALVATLIVFLTGNRICKRIIDWVGLFRLEKYASHYEKKSDALSADSCE